MFVFGFTDQITSVKSSHDTPTCCPRGGDDVSFDFVIGFLFGFVFCLVFGFVSGCVFGYVFDYVFGFVLGFVFVFVFIFVFGFLFGFDILVVTMLLLIPFQVKIGQD